MFLLSNFILKNTGLVKSSSAISTYSIAIGMVIYAALYLYVLFYHQDKLAFFNTILIYVVSFDLLLSSALYNKQVLDTKSEKQEQEKKENDNNSSNMDEFLEDEEDYSDESTDDELVASDETTNGDSEQETLDEDTEENKSDNEVKEENVEFNIPAIVITEVQE